MEVNRMTTGEVGIRRMYKIKKLWVCSILTQNNSFIN